MTDDLRRQFAKALADRLHAGTLVVHEATVATNSLNPDRYDLADAVLAVRDDELASLRLRAERAEAALACSNKSLRAAQMDIARIRELVNDPELKSVEVFDAIDAVLDQVNGREPGDADG